MMAFFFGFVLFHSPLNIRTLQTVFHVLKAILGGAPQCHRTERSRTAGDFHRQRGERRSLCVKSDRRQHRSPSPFRVRGPTPRGNKIHRNQYLPPETDPSLRLKCGPCFFSLMESTFATRTSSKHGWSSGSSVTRSPFWLSIILTCSSWATTPTQGRTDTQEWFLHVCTVLLCGEASVREDFWVCFCFFCFFSSRIESIGNRLTPQAGGGSTPDNHSTIETLSELDEGTMTPSSKWTTPANSARNSSR